ncbi:hypothetical protein SUGI_0268930 [Cryptomeria japonica]|uniref:syntaxin-125-like n=1 Tax=Cryptomeria japonica TaxID=3369 RepID=UPI002408E4C2|nr:syntaxin-125-like [Cryptomeria japonica]GLJ16131.1 hypothetical protein SUGI_0268930 [Cryptomeria japonica]
MNDLLSRSFLNDEEDEKVESPEFEMGAADAEKNLAEFFSEVALIKAEMKQIELLLLKLKGRGEENKMINRAVEMEKDIEQMLNRTRHVKAKFEELNRANLANRIVGGFEEGSSTDRSRMATTNGLRKSFQQLMSEFEMLRNVMGGEYLSEVIHERCGGVQQFGNKLTELHGLFVDMYVLLLSHGDHLDDIEAHVMAATSFVKRGAGDLALATSLHKSTRNWTYVAMIIFVLLLVILVAVMISRFLHSFT